MPHPGRGQDPGSNLKGLAAMPRQSMSSGRTGAGKEFNKMPGVGHNIRADELKKGEESVNV